MRSIVHRRITEVSVEIFSTLAPAARSTEGVRGAVDMVLKPYQWMECYNQHGKTRKAESRDV